jgi:hypothetical protein
MRKLKGKIRVLGVLGVLGLLGVLGVGVGAASAGYAGDGTPFTVNGPIVDITSGPHNQHYVVTDYGSVYTQNAPYFGGAALSNRKASLIWLCMNSGQYVIGYAVVRGDSGEGYFFGDTPHCASWIQY